MLQEERQHTSRYSRFRANCRISASVIAGAAAGAELLPVELLPAGAVLGAGALVPVGAGVPLLVGAGALVLSGQHRREARASDPHTVCHNLHLRHVVLDLHCNKKK
jgi:hypothetical protein